MLKSQYFFSAPLLTQQIYCGPGGGTRICLVAVSSALAPLFNEILEQFRASCLGCLKCPKAAAFCCPSETKAVLSAVSTSAQLTQHSHCPFLSAVSLLTTSAFLSQAWSLPFAVFLSLLKMDYGCRSHAALNGQGQGCLCCLCCLKWKIFVLPEMEDFWPAGNGRFLAHLKWTMAVLDSCL